MRAERHLVKGKGLREGGKRRGVKDGSRGQAAQHLVQNM